MDWSEGNMATAKGSGTYFPIPNMDACAIFIYLNCKHIAIKGA